MRSRQHYAFSALFPDIRELPSMTGLLDLERQGYGFRAAKLCFKAHSQEMRPSLRFKSQIWMSASAYSRRLTTHRRVASDKPDFTVRTERSSKHRGLIA
jgi:hypothetical protein